MQKTIANDNNLAAAAITNGNGASFAKNTDTKSVKIRRQQWKVPRWKEEQFVM